MISKAFDNVFASGAAVKSGGADLVMTQLEIPDRWRQELVYGALARIYEIEDTELYNQQSANDNLMKWERAMHKAEGVMLKKNRGATTVRFNRNGVW